MCNCLTLSCCLLATIALLVVQPSSAQLRPAQLLICPQPLPNDNLPPFCARNAFGSMDVTRAEFENWNCNHPYNKYRQVSQVPCTTPPETPSCPPNNCGNAGPAVCGRLRSPTPLNPNAFTTAVFGNRCQLNHYNCMNPTRHE